MRYFMGFAILLFAGCSEPAQEASPGRTIYMGNCVACHGADGQGNGPIAAELPVAPPDLTGLSLRNGGVFPSSDVMAQIYGYPGRFHVQVMPEFGQVLAGPTVMWTDETGTQIETPQPLLDLVEYLKSVQRI
ncbi:MAG: cytochrome c [Roseovarius sp.]